MERRLAVHAGGNPQALTQSRRAVWAAIAVLALAGVAEAKPRRRDARAAYDRGVTAYEKGNYIAAAESLGKSFELERDVDTLFAWAQSERQLERCDKAIELYERLLTFKLPPANKSAVAIKLDECRVILAQQRPAEPPAIAAEPPRPAETPPVPIAPAPTPSPVAAAPLATPPALPPEQPSSSSAWYKDPIALGLLGTGVAATGVGAALLLSARSLDRDADEADDYPQAVSLSDKAKSRGTVGMITAGAGGALIVGGIVWIVTHRNTTERSTITGWVAPTGGGLAVTGGF